MSGSARRSVAWRVGLVTVVAVNTIAMWSDGVAEWWSDQGDDDGGSILPGFVADLVSARPDLGDADLHAMAWALAGFVAVMAARRWSTLPWLVGAVWAWSVLVEALQPVVADTRQFAWTDLVGNTIGVVLGAALALWWRRRRDEGPWSGRDLDVTMESSPGSSRRNP